MPVCRALGVLPPSGCSLFSLRGSPYTDVSRTIPWHRPVLASFGGMEALAAVLLSFENERWIVANLVPLVALEQLAGIEWLSEAADK